MTTFNDMQGALDSHLEALSLETAWQYSRFEPTDEYVRPTFLPGQTVQETVGAAGQDYTSGIYQVDVFRIKDAGRPVLTDTIAGHFKRGTYLVYNGLTLRIISSSIARSSEEEKYSITPVEIRWETLTEART